MPRSRTSRGRTARATQASPDTSAARSISAWLGTGGWTCPRTCVSSASTTIRRHSPRSPKTRFWLFDAAIRLYSEDGCHSLALIGRNLGDEIYIIAGRAIPGRCPNYMAPRTCDNTGPNSLDRTVATPTGRTLNLQYRFSL